MEPQFVQGLYDHGYADAYDDRFLTGEGWSKQGSAFELGILERLLARAGARWLDVGCGTGFYLGRFPEVERAGLDLSPAMLAVAARANPSIDLVQGSYLDDRPDWHDRWTLVSCMWAAYSYVTSLAEIETLVSNLVAWTAPNGVVFLPVCDVADLAGGIDVPYRNDDTWVFGGELLIRAVVWDWKDEALGKHHRNLLAPHLDCFVELFSKSFRRVEVVRYPPYLPGWGTRKAIVASEKRGTNDDAPCKVVRHAAPECTTVFPSSAVAVASEHAPEHPDGRRGAIEEIGGPGTLRPEAAPPSSKTSPDLILPRSQAVMSWWWGSMARRARRGVLNALRSLERRLEG